MSYASPLNYDKHVPMCSKNNVEIPRRFKESSGALVFLEWRCTSNPSILQVAQITFSKTCNFWKLAIGKGHSVH